MRPDPTQINQLPVCLPQFDHVNRFFDKNTRMPTAKILPGEYYVTCDNEVIGTVLGSCISACIRDTIFGVGGMNHFMLPIDQRTESTRSVARQISDATRYGNYAMEHLINDILKQGGKRKNLEVKLFGGARVIDGLSDIGEKNASFVLEYLHIENMPVVAEDLRGEHPRKIIYYPKTGRVRVKWLKSMHNDTISKRENNYRALLNQTSIEGDIELFD